MQCTIPCEADAWEGFEPLVLGNHLLGGVIEGFVCQSDPTDDFELDISGPAYVLLELYADSKPGNVDVALIDAGNVMIVESKTSSELEVIHYRLLLGGSYRVRVSLASGPAGAPFRLSYRTLLQ